MDEAQRGDNAVVADVAASFQHTVAETLIEKCKLAVQNGCTDVVFSGGVAANRYLRTRLEVALSEVGARIGHPLAFVRIMR